MIYYPLWMTYHELDHIYKCICSSSSLFYSDYPQHPATNTHSFFVGDRSIPTLSRAFSIFSSTSSAFVVCVPSWMSSLTASTASSIFSLTVFSFLNLEKNDFFSFFGLQHKNIELTCPLLFRICNVPSGFSS